MSSKEKKIMRGLEDPELLRWILETLSLPFDRVWRRLPSSMEPVWLEVGQVQMHTNRPLEILGWVLVEALEHGTTLSDQKHGSGDNSYYELWVLFRFFVLNSPYEYLFSEPQTLKHARAKGKDPRQSRLHESFLIWDLVAKHIDSMLSNLDSKRNESRVSFDSILAELTWPCEPNSFRRRELLPVDRVIQRSAVETELAILELSTLLKFFALDYEEMWIRILDEVPEVEVPQALFHLSQQLVSRLDDWAAEQSDIPGGRGRELQVLSALVYWFILEGGQESLEMPSEESLDPPFVVWRFVNRLCLEALSDPRIKSADKTGVSLARLAESNSQPAGSK